jgi:hypothetical protein
VAVEKGLNGIGSFRGIGTGSTEALRRWKLGGC